MKITYTRYDDITSEEFIDILQRSTLAKRRPVDDKARIDNMIQHADIIIIAKIDENIVGVARSITDYTYCCYLSDLAVDTQYQHKGIGKTLIDKTRALLDKHCKLILLSAPNATQYYPKLGFTQHPSAWYIHNA